ncbi:diguanylate cyclase [uncultured Zoogloea sp.]|uniref:diguanylate cyclase domain-containing protein n=1 Tax=uncultured Zoogloea sp. TaxID=160237 RepID=UPI00260ED5F0|nr:diguanylate cyclase [uncultured Zoogloea sp.]
MPIPVSTLIGSPRRLITAIVMFVALDLSVLMINLWLANQIAQDAVAINLAGRQRMLSQQTTKALLLTTRATTPNEVNAAAQEVDLAFGLFERTLLAFADGGQTTGGDDAPVTLQAVEGEAAEVVARARTLITPVRGLLPAAATAQEGRAYTAAADYMVGNNREILALMNRLTTALEHDSVRRSRDLRAIQTGAFVLALGNFLVIVLGMLRRHRQMEKESERWREMARHDPLTGLANRKAFTETGLGILARARVDGSAGAVLVIDLDGFKPINDRFGHATGDQVLVQLAARLESTARTTDLVARLGGDEFAILCPNLHDPEHIGQFCNRLVAAIGDIPDDICPGNALGASIGIATYPKDGYDLHHILGQADRAMYAAKQAGGSRWKLA